MWNFNVVRAVSPLALLLLSQPAGAADIGPATKDGYWRGVGGAALSATTGNTETSAALFNLDTARATDADKIALGGSYNLARGTNSDGTRTTTADKAFAFGQYDRDFAPRWFGFGRAAFDKDRLIDLSLRSAWAGGVGYRVIDTDTTTFTLQGGLGYTTERYGSLQTIDGATDTRFERPSVFLAEESAHKLSQTVSLRQRLQANPSIGGAKGVLVKFDAALVVALNSSLSLNVGLIDSYNSEPPEGTKRNDLSLFTGVSFKFGGP